MKNAPATRSETRVPPRGSCKVIAVCEASWVSPKYTPPDGQSPRPCRYAVCTCRSKCHFDSLYEPPRPRGFFVFWQPLAPCPPSRPGGPWVVTDLSSDR